ncbi:hypothetical protein OF83DRAFT_1143849 [Amylostereum chailletii]|nr:hypothetical protein OF83DRAFT_1143849 [Amylostereum chailletii]
MQLIGWGGLDTLVVSAGVSATRPLLDVAGADLPDGPTAAGAQRAAQAAQSALNANYLGPLLSAVTLIPFMERTSRAPSILLISSLGAAIPAPTRSLYGSSKAASLALYQALAIEHSKVSFTYILPSTVQGNFRSSAVDVDTGAEDTTPNRVGLTPEAVALRSQQAVDNGEKVVFYPSSYRWAQLLYWLWPSFVERKAAKKYHFTT